jgi:hypothetical protein
MEGSCQIHVPIALPPSKTPQQPLNKHLDVPTSQSGRFGGENNFLAMPEIEPW